MAVVKGVKRAKTVTESRKKLLPAACSASNTAGKAKSAFSEIFFENKPIIHKNVFIFEQSAVI